ncbi:hypothetical protein [Catenulispora pinisilvae]|uniref:hypothetical protein n=1 Tax=Catenulispora pinisilvae TaxID=2705253 RepID=UPI001892494B|nr:hypothetical protein [Catenulispora pinisilvae]
MTETPASTPDAAAKRSAAVVLGGCCLGVLLVLIGITVGRQHGRPPTSPSTLDRVTGVGGVWFLAFGLALLPAQGLWGQRSRPAPTKTRPPAT